MRIYSSETQALKDMTKIYKKASKTGAFKHNANIGTNQQFHHKKNVTSAGDSVQYDYGMATTKLSSGMEDGISSHSPVQSKYYNNSKGRKSVEETNNNKGMREINHVYKQSMTSKFDLESF